MRWPCPSLHRSYPASSVLQTSPLPEAAQPVPRGRLVEGERPITDRVSRVALYLHVPTCHRRYPGGPLSSDRSWDGLFQPFPFIPSGGGLPDPSARSASALVVSRPARRSRVLRPVGSSSRHATRLSRRLRRFCCLHRRSDSYRLERPSCRVGLAPTEDQQLTTAHTRSAPEHRTASRP